MEILSSTNSFYDRYSLSTGAVWSCTIISTLGSLALILYSLRRQKNSMAFLLIGLACIASCYVLCVEKFFYRTDEYSSVNFNMLQSLAVSLTAALGILANSKDKGFSHRCLEFACLLVLMWHLTTPYGLRNSYIHFQIIVIVNVWLGAWLFSFVFFLAVRRTKLITKLAIGLSLIIAIVSASFWTHWITSEGLFSPSAKTITIASAIINTIVPFTTLFTFVSLSMDNNEEEGFASPLNPHV